MKHTLRITLIIISTMLTTGCASLFQGGQQFLMPKTLKDANRKETKCSMSNSSGAWTVRPYTNGKISRDYEDMHITCENDTQIGTATAPSTVQIGWLVLNFLGDFCIISCPVDMISRSLYKYPSSISIPMHDRGNYVEPIAPPVNHTIEASFDFDEEDEW